MTHAPTYAPHPMVLAATAPPSGPAGRVAVHILLLTSP